MLRRVAGQGRVEQMIGQIISAVGGLATSWIDGKTAIQKAEAQIRMKQATGEIDWDLEAIRSAQHSWKDEWLTVLFSVPLILSFCGEWGRERVAEGFAALSAMPDWYQVSLGAIVAASFGIRSVSKFFGKKK